MKQFASFVRKEFYHALRDRKTFFLLFGMPIALIILFGFAINNEIKNSRIAVCDFSKDAATQRIINQLEVSDNFEIEKAVLSYTQIDAAFKAGKIKIAIVFPANFNNDLLHLNKAQVQIIADASDPNVASALTAFVNAIIHDYQMELMQNYQVPFQITAETQMLYNPLLKGPTNFVPGVIALVLLMIGMLMTSVSIVREKETGTMEVLLASPFNPFVAIIAKAVPYFVLSLINLVVIVVLSVTFLDMPFNGSVILFFAVSSLFILTTLSIGLFISVSTDSQQTALLLAAMAMLIPAIMLTGFLFPLEDMPLAFRIFANVLPSKWYYIIVKSIMIKGLGFSAIWRESLILLVMNAVPIFGTFKKFKIRLV